VSRETIERAAGSIAVSYLGDSSSSEIPILFIHPINLQGAAWNEIVTAFGDRLLIVPDMRGFGDSPPVSEYGVALWAQDCIDAVDRAGVDRFHAVGGSLGGPIATYIASVIPERVVSVMAVGSQLFSANPDNAAVLSTLEDHTVPEMFSIIIPKYSLGPNASAEVIAKTLAICNPNGPEDVRRVWRAANSTDVREQAAVVTCPATVVTGEFDLTCVPEAGAAMAAALDAPHIILPGIGHLPMLEAPGLLVPLIEDHLERVEAGLVR
jgi:pimeloyl-ACP methyl ester carboxylesterase